MKTTLKQKESKYCYHRKWNMKTVRAKGRQIFFSGRTKQNKVGGKEWLGCFAFARTLKQDNRVAFFIQLRFISLNRWRKLVSLLLQLYFVSLYRWRKFVFLLPQPFLCFTFLWQQYLLSFCSNKRLKSIWWHNRIGSACNYARDWRNGLVKKLDIWIPHELKEIHLTKRINACDLHFKRNEFDPFLKQIKGAHAITV